MKITLDIDSVMPLTLCDGDILYHPDMRGRNKHRGWKCNIRAKFLIDGRPFCFNHAGAHLAKMVEPKSDKVAEEHF